MNSKLIKASVAGAAVVALAAGGSTYAAYSDFANVTGNAAGAGTLTLDLGANGGSALQFDHVFMAPGDVGAQRNVYVAQNNGTAATKSKLYFTLKDLIGTEDGCAGNSEVIDDPNCATKGDGTLAGNQGQFIKDADLTITSYLPNNPATTPVCNPSYATKATDITPERTYTLQQWATQTAATPYELTGDMSGSGGPNVSKLSNGQGICVSMQIGLPFNTNNESQGDQASFTSHFDLNQVS